MNKRLIVLILPILLLAALFFDREIVRFSTSFRIGFLDTFFIAINYVGAQIVIVIITTLILLYKNKIKYLPIIWLSFLIITIIVESLKFGISRTRPEVLHLVEVSTSSFPSGHTAIIFTPLALFQKLFLRFKWIWLIFALTVAFSRLYLGVHYLSDVIAGGLIGYLVTFLMLKLEAKHKFLERTIDKIKY